MLRGDSFNLLLAEQGSPYYSGTGLYALRYFGFDFSSKKFPLALPVRGEPHFVNKCDVLAMETGDILEVVKLGMIEAVDVMDYLLGQPIVKDQVYSFQLQQTK